MQIHNLIQGSQEWHAHRAQFLNASDAPAMLGESKYVTREELLHQMATGIKKPVDARTQKLFDDGHKFEALGRPIAEKIIERELYPVTGSDSDSLYSASFDGITMEEDEAFEHKKLNKDLRAHFANGGEGHDLPLMYRIQMEQQAMIGNLKRILFMASEWDNNDELIEEHHCWYYPDLELRQRIIDGWALFKKDLVNYKAPEVKEVAVAEVIEALPAPAIVAKGTLVQSNLNEITPQFDKYLAETKRSGFETDQDFANAEANGKNARQMEKLLNDSCDAVVAQQSDISKAITIMRKYAGEFKALGLALEKAVKAEKEAIKTKAILDARAKYAEHVNKLQAEIVGVSITPKLIAPDFAEAIKGVRSHDSMHSRIKDALNAGILDADALARSVREKLAYLEDATKGYEGLFADKQTFIFTDLDHIKLMVDARINTQKLKEAEREAQLKAQAEADARAKIAAEEAAKEIQESKAKAIESVETVIEKTAPATTQLPVQLEAEFGKHFGSKEEFLATTTRIVTSMPSGNEVVDVVAAYYGVEPEMAKEWLQELFAVKQAA